MKPLLPHFLQKALIGETINTLHSKVQCFKLIEWAKKWIFEVFKIENIFPESVPSIDNVF